MIKKLTNAVNLIRRQQIDPWILGILLGAIVTVLLILSNYANCYQEAESVINFTPAVLEKGEPFSAHDFVNIFNVWGLDNGWNRPRFISYSAYIIAIKTRLLLWDVMLPHPTLSILWVFTLILAPWIFYKFLKIILNKETAALAGVAVYLSSCGYLFSGTMLMHPGKPLLNLVVISILYLMVKDPPVVTKTQNNPLFRRSVILGIIPLLTAALFMDEMATFCFVLLLVWRFHYFLPYRFTWENIKTCGKNILLYCIPAMILMIMVLGVTPYIAQHAFGQNYDFFGCITKNAHLNQINIQLLLWNTLTFFSASFLPWDILNLKFPVPDADTNVNLPGIMLFYLGLGFIFIIVLAKDRQYRLITAKILILMALFLILQTINISFHIQKIVLTGYYYGAPFCILFATLIALAVAIMNQQVRFGKWLARILLIYIVVMQFTNFLVLNMSWQKHSDWKATVGVPAKDLETLKGRVIYLIKKKLKDELKSEYKVYYPGNLAAIEPAKKFRATEAFWKEWKSGQCNLFSQKHDIMFVQNLWLYGELCPEQFKEFYGHTYP